MATKKAVQSKNKRERPVAVKKVSPKPKITKPEPVENSGAKIPEILERAAEVCPYCESKDFVKRGLRENKHQAVQLYVCRNTECGRTFTSRTIKGKQFPWPVVLDAVSYHNLGYTFEQAAQILEAKRGVKPMPDTVAKWYEN